MECDPLRSNCPGPVWERRKNIDRRIPVYKGGRLRTQEPRSSGIVLPKYNTTMPQWQPYSQRWQDTLGNMWIWKCWTQRAIMRWDHEKNKNAMLVPGTQKLWTSSIFKITHQKNNKHAVGLPMLISMVTWCLQHIPTPGWAHPNPAPRPGQTWSLKA